MYTYRSRRKSPIKQKTSGRRYYRYMGFRDGSGKPEGLVIKCFTEEEYRRYTNAGCVYILIE